MIVIHSPFLLYGAFLGDLHFKIFVKIWAQITYSLKIEKAIKTIIFSNTKLYIVEEVKDEDGVVMRTAHNLELIELHTEHSVDMALQYKNGIVRHGPIDSWWGGMSLFLARKIQEKK